MPFGHVVYPFQSTSQSAVMAVRSIRGLDIVRHGIVGFCLSLLVGCQAGYYSHLARGHLSLMAAREPVEKVLSREDLDPQRRQQLELSQALLDFAGNELGLPADKVYRDYVELPEDWVVWNLFAAPEFSLTPHTWCYPVAGCAGYRGYFDRQRAARDQQRFEDQGLDVYGAGAIAYSTLGWFRDPLTSAMVSGDDVWFAELLFHELVHRRFYLKGDTRFNESLATAVAREGVRRWLALQGEALLHEASSRAALLARRDESRSLFLTLIGDTRAELDTLYRSGQPEPVMREAKAAIFEGLRQRYRQMLTNNPGLAGYQSWFDGPLNNATLNMVSDYHDQVPAFDALILRCGGHWPCFWEEVTRISRLPPTQRAAFIESLND